MTAQEMEALLRQTLTDARLSGGERSALQQVLADTHLDEQRTAALRRVAFELAKDHLGDPKAREVFDWLEDVVKVLHPVKAGGVPAASEAWFAPEQNLTARVVALFAACRHTAEVCVFTITDDRLSDALLAAHGRGVKVRVVTDDEKSADLGSDISRFRLAGVPVRLDDSPAHMHHKFAIFDGIKLLTGSFNWTRSAQAANNENFLVTSEAGLVRAYAAEFERLWERMER